MITEETLDAIARQLDRAREALQANDIEKCRAIMCVIREQAQAASWQPKPSDPVPEDR